MLLSKQLDAEDKYQAYVFDMYHMCIYQTLEFLLQFDWYITVQCSLRIGSCRKFLKTHVESIKDCARTLRKKTEREKKFRNLEAC